MRFCIWEINLGNRRWSILLIIIPVLLVAAITIFSLGSYPRVFYPGNQGVSQDHTPSKPEFKQAKKYDSIKGLNFNYLQKNKVKASLRVDSYSVADKKMGVFRFGLLREAKLKNLQLSVYDHHGTLVKSNSEINNNSGISDSRGIEPILTTPVEEDAFPSKNKFSLSNPMAVDDNKEGSMERLSSNFGEEIKQLFGQIFNKGITGDKIHSWMIESFLMRIYSDDKELLSTINSDSAILGGSGSSIKFKGNFNISAKNGKILKAERATYDILNGVFHISTPYTLEPGGAGNEEYLEVDPLLEKVTLLK